MKKHFRKIAISFAVVCLLLFVSVAFIFYLKSRPLGDGKVSVEFTVRSGWGSILVTNKMHSQKLVRSPRVFRYLLFLTGKQHKIKKGIYELNDSMSAMKIIDIITNGKTKTVSFTIPEGYHNRQMGDLLVKKGLFQSKDEFLQMASSKPILEKFSIPAKTLEGYLFPETYTIPVKYPKEKIIENMVKEFFRQVKKIPNFPASNHEIHKIVTMASIVEREARKVNERALIAGVLYNRLKRNQRLQVDASIQYLFPAQRKKVYYKDLEIDSPYNTYKHRGLPPGPISNPGLSSLKAAVSPEKTEFFYYVAKPDGSHSFSKNYSRHLKAKKKYIGP